MDKITKLSQAIRLGATFHPQCQQSFFRYASHRSRDLGNIESSCARGAAWLALGYDPIKATDIFIELNRRFGLNMSLTGQIAEWNDHGMSREEIADRLEKQNL
jgi:hypothetical protein